MARARRTRTAASTSKSTTKSTAPASTAAAKPQTSTSAASSFVCPECGRTFARPAALGAHRRRVHNIAGARSARTARSTTGRRRATRTVAVRTASAAPVATATTGVDRDALLAAVFPNGVPPKESVIREVSAWLDEAEKLARRG